MNLLDSLNVFLQIVERGTLAAAGRDLGLSPAVVSDRLSNLEAHYGAPLLRRTTRAISLTPEGQLLLDGARQLIDDARDLEARLRVGMAQLSGHLKLSAPIDLGRQQIAHAVSRYMAAHPGVSVELVLSDAYLDLVGQGIDLAVRMGDLKDSSLRAIPLAATRRLVCAAPTYLARCGEPQQPADLSQHHCLLMRFGMGLDRDWAFMENGQRRTQRVQGNRIANDGGQVRQWCIEGHGIALKSYWDIRDDLLAGRLVELLRPFAMPTIPLQIVLPGGPAMPERVRALIDVLQAHFAVGASDHV
jgi:DNA-binding transcriptional LysR family regulator